MDKSLQMQKKYIDALPLFGAISYYWDNELYDAEWWFSSDLSFIKPKSQSQRNLRTIYFTEYLNNHSAFMPY